MDPIEQWNNRKNMPAANATEYAFGDAHVNKKIEYAFDDAMQHTAKESAEEAAEKVARRIHTFNTKALPGIIGIGATIIGSAAIADIIMNNAREDRAVRENMIYDRNKKRQTEKDQKEFDDAGYGFETYQEVVQNAEKGKRFKKDPVIQLLQSDSIVQNLYSNRTGHTNMGNSRFK